MLAQARKTLPDARVAWQQADALALPFERRTVLTPSPASSARCSFRTGSKGSAEARRVLKDGGRFFFNVWDRIEDNEFADVVTQALAEIFPHDPPRFLARTPHGYCDEDQIRSDLKAAGFTDITIDAVEHRSRAPSPREPAIAYLPGHAIARRDRSARRAGLEAATAAATEALTRRFGSGAIDGRNRALVISAG